jgi:hypothetical protein
MNASCDCVTQPLIAGGTTSGAVHSAAFRHAGADVSRQALEEPVAHRLELNCCGNTAGWWRLVRGNSQVGQAPARFP